MKENNENEEIKQNIIQQIIIKEWDFFQNVHNTGGRASCQNNYEEMLSILMRQLLICIHRELQKERKISDIYLDNEMDMATQYFTDNYSSDISIEEYASSRGMSISWFIRNFKKFTGITPMHFIVSTRISNAQLLLETTKYSISEISRIVGYDNPLYFSRLFHKVKGFAPSEYRKSIK